MNPTKEFRDYLISQGAALVGIGDLTAVPSSDYPVGIAVAIPLPKHIIKGLQLAPTREYYELYNSLSDKLNTIVTAGTKYLIQITVFRCHIKRLPPEPVSAGSVKTTGW